MTSETIEVIDQIVAEAVAENGFSAYAGGMLTGPMAHSSQPFYFMNWPESWLKIYAERGFLRKDPAPRWTIISGAPASWTEIVASLPPKDPGHEVLNEAIKHGYREGLVVPVRTRNGSLGVVSAGGDRDRLRPEEMAPLVALFTAALLRADVLVGATRQPKASPLTLRERECASLMVQGLGDAQIAFALGISTETVRFHLDNARKRLGARTRAQLAALAAGYTGQND